MARAQIRCGGVWLSSVAQFGDLEWSTRWPGGCHEASWKMDLPAKAAPHFLRRGQPVGIWVGAKRVWRGTLQVPERGDGWELSATGWYREADHAHALTSGGATTSTPDTAIDQAIARGALHGARVQSFSTTPVVDGDTTDELMKVSALLDLWADEAGERWAVNADGFFYHAPDPTVPSWYVTPGSAVLGASDAEYATHIYGRYLRTSDMSYQTAVAGDDVAATNFGRVEIPVDLTNRGPITTVRAQAIVDGILAKGKARLGLANDLEPGPWELIAPGGPKADPRFVRAGQMVRVFGATDPTGIEKLKTDVVIGQTRYRDGDAGAVLSPMDRETNTLAEAIEKATRAA